MGFLSGITNALGTNVANGYQANIQDPNAALFQMPNMQQQQQSLAQAITNGNQATAAQTGAAAAAGPSLGGVNQTLTAQQRLANTLSATAAGMGQSAAQNQLTQGLQQQLAQQRAAQASTNGNVNPMLAQRQVAQNAAATTQATNAAAATQRAQEAATAQGLQAQVLGTVGNQNLSAAQLQQQNSQFNAGNQQQANLANQSAQMQQQGINNQNAQFYTGQQGALNQAQLGANVQQAGQDLQAQTANVETNAQTATANANRQSQANSQLFGGALGAAGALFSDERLKTNVKREVDADMDDFFKKLDTASYEYRDPALGKGRHWSAMAQSAARSEAGRSFVVKTPQGLALDTRKGFGVALAAMKHLSDRQGKLESLMVKKAARRG